MTWREINPRFVRQDYPHLRARWFCDTSSRGGGHLFFWQDARGRVVGFKLTREEWPSLHRYEAEWQVGRRPWITEEEMAPSGYRPARLAVPALAEHPPGRQARAAWRLLTYFQENASLLPADQRRTIKAVLGEVSDLAA